MTLENPYEVVCDSRIFEKKIAPKIGKITKNAPKAEFFDFIEEFGH